MNRGRCRWGARRTRNPASGPLNRALFSLRFPVFLINRRTIVASFASGRATVATAFIERWRARDFANQAKAKKSRRRSSFPPSTSRPHPLSPLSLLSLLSLLSPPPLNQTNRPVPLLQADQEQALPQVPLLPRCPRPQDPHLRRRAQACAGRRFPALRPPRLVGEGTDLFRGHGGCPYRCQQVHGREIR